MRESDDFAGGAQGLYGCDLSAKFGKWRDEALATGATAKLHAWKGGVIGFVTDFMLERLPWSFRLEDITLGERLTFWVGEKDIESMVVGSPWMQTLVPGSKLQWVQGGDHGFKSEPQHLSAILVELRDQFRAAAQGK